MLDALGDVSGPYQRLSLFSYILFLYGVWLCRILLVFLNKIFRYLSQKKKKRGRGFAFVDWCVMCRCGETVDYLMLHCEKAHQLWCFIFRSFGVSWVLLRMVPDILFSRWNWLGKHLSNISNLVLLCLMWCIWREHNRQTFEYVDSSGDQLPASFSSSLYKVKWNWSNQLP